MVSRQPGVHPLKRFVVLAALAFAACSPSGQQPADTAAPAEPAAAPAPTTPAVSGAMTADGWGPLRIGMTKDEVIAAVGPTKNPGAVGGPDEEACTEFQPERAPDGLWVMIEEGKLTRITIGDNSPVQTDKGLGVGATAEQVKATYGDAAQSSPHKYQDAPAEYIAVWSGGPRSEPYVQDPNARGIVYEIDGAGKASFIHAGGPSIQYVEGCA